MSQRASALARSARSDAKGFLWAWGPRGCGRGEDSPSTLTLFQCYINLLLLSGEAEPVSELRRYQRTTIDVAVEFVAKGGDRKSSGRATDISLGGMFIKTDAPLGFSAELVVHVTLPGRRSPFALPAVVRWSGEAGMGVQFGLIGARETHAITELTKTT